MWEPLREFQGRPPENDRQSPITATSGEGHIRETPKQAWSDSKPTKRKAAAETNSKAFVSRGDASVSERGRLAGDRAKYPAMGNIYLFTNALTPNLGTNQMVARNILAYVYIYTCSTFVFGLLRILRPHLSSQMIAIARGVDAGKSIANQQAWTLYLVCSPLRGPATCGLQPQGAVHQQACSKSWGAQV